jgi:hypothetical protein
MGVETRLSLALAAALVAAATLAAPAGARVFFSASMTPGPVHYPGTRTLEYRLEIRTTTRAQHLTIELQAPGWGLTGPAGSPVRLLGRPRLDGAGELVAFHQIAFGGAAQMCVRGYATASPYVEVTLPENATTTLVATYETGRAAPFPDTDYRVTFVARGLAGRMPEVVEARPPRPALAGKTGVRLSLRTNPARPRRGQMVAVVGRATPALAGDAVHLVAARGRKGPAERVFFEGPSYPRDYEPPRPLGDVRVNEGGRFAFGGWELSGRHYFAVQAVYRSRRPDVVSDRSCPLQLWVS